MYNPTLDGDTLHVDDYTDGGPALNAVRFIIPDREAMARRNVARIHESIALRKAHEAKVAEGIEKAKAHFA